MLLWEGIKNIYIWKYWYVYSIWLVYCWYTFGILWIYNLLWVWKYDDMIVHVQIDILNYESHLRWHDLNMNYDETYAYFIMWEMWRKLVWVEIMIHALRLKGVENLKTEIERGRKSQEWPWIYEKEKKEKKRKYELVHNVCERVRTTNKHNHTLLHYVCIWVLKMIYLWNC